MGARAVLMPGPVPQWDAPLPKIVLRRLWNDTPERTFVGLTNGDRPSFGFPGAWLYDGEKPAVHLTLATEPAAQAAPAVDHVAFAYEALDEALKRLDRLNLRYTRPKPVPGTEIRQCFLKDPNGITVELQGP